MSSKCSFPPVPRNQNDPPAHPILSSLSVLFCYHQGTAAKGSFLITVTRIPRVILMPIYNTLKDPVRQHPKADRLRTGNPRFRAGPHTRAPTPLPKLCFVSSRERSRSSSVLAGILLIKMRSKRLSSDGAVSASVCASFSCLFASKDTL